MKVQIGSGRYRLPTFRVGVLGHLEARDLTGINESTAAIHDWLLPKYADHLLKSLNPFPARRGEPQIPIRVARSLPERPPERLVGNYAIAPPLKSETKPEPAPFLVIDGDLLYHIGLCVAPERSLFDLDWLDWDSLCFFLALRIGEVIEVGGNAYTNLFCGRLAESAAGDIYARLQTSCRPKFVCALAHAMDDSALPGPLRRYIIVQEGVEGVSRTISALSAANLNRARRDLLHSANLFLSSSEMARVTFGLPREPSPAPQEA